MKFRSTLFRLDAPRPSLTYEHFLGSNLANPFVNASLSRHEDRRHRNRCIEDFQAFALFATKADSTTAEPGRNWARADAERLMTEAFDGADHTDFSIAPQTLGQICEFTRATRMNLSSEGARFVRNTLEVTPPPGGDTFASMFGVRYADDSALRMLGIVASFVGEDWWREVDAARTLQDWDTCLVATLGVMMSNDMKISSAQLAPIVALRNLGTTSYATEIMELLSHHLVPELSTT